MKAGSDMMTILNYQVKRQSVSMGRKFLLLIAGTGTLFCINDTIVDESLDKWRQFLLELAISSRHCNN